jgi:hypothetical protein
MEFDPQYLRQYSTNALLQDLTPAAWTPAACSCLPYLQLLAFVRPTVNLPETTAASSASCCAFHELLVI